MADQDPFAAYAVSSGKDDPFAAFVVQPDAKPKAQEKSLGGFASNIVTSGGRFLKDTATGLVDAGKFLADISPMSSPDKKMERAQQAKELFSNAPRIIRAAGGALNQRYGGVQQIKDTLYNDPVGVLGDVSALATGGEMLAPKASRLARVLSATGEATNPMRAVGAATEAVTGPVANTIVRGTLRPPAAVRADFGGSKAVADAVIKDRVYSEASAQRKLSGSVADADRVIADAQAAGAPGVRRTDVARSVLGAPKDTAQLRTRLGVPDQTGDLTATAKAIFKSNPSEIPLTDAQAMKREAQKLAYEAGTDNLTVKKAAETEKAKALRAGIEQSVPEVGPINERSQRLLGSQQAFSAAEDRPRALTNFLSVLGAAGGAAGGGPLGAAAVPLAIKAIDSPRLGAMTGIGVDAFGKGINAESLRRAAILSRLLEQEPDQ